ncbi:MAG: molybdenum ABC transporter ATP-binding protein [Candidatus Nitronauta litoralis]|uniref:Molybdenum ABC transporter ATP-binding protein n=1 Tax=Candidatus Nitronauta litoralis TaxID=2705533 RepID=A0A7T0BV62_9BACT|nr:MAG: molybdenum ABC transporter ATP-binding protein [Candidatus Nitronauta litoralis]
MSTQLKAKIKIQYPGFQLDTDLSLPLDGVTVIFGPSGCGKTTLLRCLSGLEKPDTGSVTFGDAVWQHGEEFLPPHKRPIGFVFQDARLFPHKNVRDNLLYGYKRIPQAERRIAPDQIIELLGLSKLLDRFPKNMSAGEKQRVAIGRALLTSPRILMMDEPLANLDMPRKQEILPYLSRLRSELNIPILYVSHSLDEVLQLVDTLVLLEDGRVQAAGKAQEVLAEISPGQQPPPALAGTLLDTIVTDHEEEYKLTRLTFGDQPLHVPKQNLKAGSTLRLHVLARDVSLVTGPRNIQTSVLNILEGRVTAIEAGEPEDHSVNVMIDIGQPLLATITKKSLSVLKLEPGQTVFAHIKALRMIH